MTEDGKPNGDNRNDEPFVDPVTGERVADPNLGEQGDGWLPPARDVESTSGNGSQESFGGWIPPAAGPGQPIASVPAVVRNDYASWWSRVGANLLDTLIIFVPIAIVAAIVYLLAIGDSVTWSEDRQEFEGTIDGAQIAAIVIPGIFAAIYAIGYAPFLLARTNGQTIGKMATNIRVVRQDGERIGFWFAAGREVGVKGLGVGLAGQFTFGIASLLNYMWPLWDKENRAVHDLIVKTHVVKSSPGDPLSSKASQNL